MESGLAILSAVGPIARATGSSQGRRLDESLSGLGRLCSCARSEEAEELLGVEIRPFGPDQMRTAAWKQIGRAHV